jgi:hypothetical protein
MSDEDQLIEEAKKLPIAEQVCHKLWRVRESALRKLRETVSEGGSRPSVSEANWLVAAVRDTNAAVQLAALDAVVAFCDACPDEAAAGTVFRKSGVAAAVARGIAEKCLAGRPQNRARAMDAALALVSCDAGDEVAGALCDVGYEHRLPKVVAASAEVLRECIKNFGCGEQAGGAISAQSASRGLIKLLDHSSQDVRSAGKSLLLEIFQWLGPVFLECILRQECLKSVLKTELEDACRCLTERSEIPPGSKRVPPRLTRRLDRIQQSKMRETQHPSKARADNSTGGHVDAAPTLSSSCAGSPGTLITDIVSAVQVRVDAEEEGQPQQTLDFHQALSHRKWNVRKSALDALLERMSAASSIDATQGGRLAAELQRIMAKDANVAVATAAARVTAQLAARAGRTLSSHGKPLAAAALGRLKEKNRILLEALRSALDALATSNTVDFAEMANALAEAATAKVPGARASALQWCAKLICTSTTGDLRPALRELKPALAQSAGDAAADVREAALECIGLLRSRCGDHAFTSLLEGLEKSKVDKIQKITKDANERQAATLSLTPRSMSNGQSMPRPNAASYLSASIMEDSLLVASKDSAAALDTAAFTDKVTIANRKHATEQDGNCTISNGGKPSVNSDLHLRQSVSTMQPIQPNEKELLDLGLPELIDQDRLRLEQYLGDARIVESDAELRQCKVLLQRLHQALGRCQRNCIRTVQLVSLAETVAGLWMSIPSLTNCAGILARAAELGSPGLVFACFERLFSERPGSHSLVFGLDFVHDHLIQRFGVDSLPIGAVLELTRPLLENESSVAFESALRIVATIIRRKYAADVERGFEELGVPASCRQALLQSNRENAVPASRNITGSDKSMDESSAKKAVAWQEQAPGANYPAAERNAASSFLVMPGKPADHVTHKEPRPLLVLERTAVLVQGLESPNWKLRQEALNELLRLLEDPQTALDIHKLPAEFLKALTSRIADTNRNLAIIALTVLTRLGRATATAMSCGQARGADDSVLRLFLGSVVQHGISDNKKMVREAALQCFAAWYLAFERAQPDGRLAFAKYLAAALSLELPASRLDTLQWIIEHWTVDGQARAPLEAEGRLLLEPTLHCLRDKNAQVRQHAERLLELIVRLVGYGTVSSHIQEGDNDHVRRELLSRMEKFRGMSPARMGASAASSVQSSPGDSPSTNACAREASHTRVSSEQPLAQVVSPSVAAAGEHASPATFADFQLDSMMQDRESQFAALLAQVKAETAAAIQAAKHGNTRDASLSQLPSGAPNASKTRPGSVDKLEDNEAPRHGVQGYESLTHLGDRRATLQHPGSTTNEAVAPTPCLPHGRYWRRAAAAATDAATEQPVRLTQVLLNSTASSEERIHAAKELSAAMKDNRGQLLQNHAGDLCLGLVQGMRAVLARPGDSKAVDAADMRVVKYQLNALMHLIMKRELAQALSLPALELLIEEVVDRLLDPRVPEYPEGPQLLRAYNLMMLKTLEHVSFLLLSRALIRALRATGRHSHPWSATEPVVGTSDAVPNRRTLLQKCLHRLSNQVLSTDKTTVQGNNLIQRDIDAHLDMLLYELHVLFTQCAVLPAADTQQTCTEARLLVQALFVHCGAQTLRVHLRLVPVTVQPYLARLLDALAQGDPHWDRLPLLLQLPTSGHSLAIQNDIQVTMRESTAQPPLPAPSVAHCQPSSPRASRLEAKERTSSIQSETQHIRERLAHLRAQRQRHV